MAVPHGFARFIGPALVLTLIVGCTHSQKKSSAGTTTPQVTAQPAPAQPAPAQPVAKPVAAPAADKLTPAAKAEKPAQPPAGEKPGPAPVAPEKPKAPPKEEPPARQMKEAVPAEPAQGQAWNIPQDRPMTDQERDALAALIRAAAEEGQKRQAAEPPKPKSEVKPTTQPAGTHGHEQAKKEGCGSSGGATVDLTPPAPDQPQPKLECKDKKVVAQDVWQGKSAEFNFTLTNAGEGPLAIRIKKP